MRGTARRPRARRDSGIIGHAIVLSLSIVIGAVLIATEATTAPFFAEARRLAPSDEAFALAESGLLAARAELQRDGGFSGLQGAPLGRGHVDVKVEPSGSERVVISQGVVAAPLLMGKGGRVTRRLRARMELVPGAPPRIIEWKEL